LDKFELKQKDKMGSTIGKEIEMQTKLNITTRKQVGSSR